MYYFIFLLLFCLLGLYGHSLDCYGHFASAGRRGELYDIQSLLVKGLLACCNNMRSLELARIEERE